MNFDKYIPWDKSWIIRMAVLDLISGRNQIYDFLDKQTDLSNDLVSLKTALTAWHKGDVVDVGESGTLFRFLSFLNEMLGLHKTIQVQGTLIDRVKKMTPVSELVGLSQAELLKVDNRTSQWASAKALMGDTERLENVPYKLSLTYEAILDHNMCEKIGVDWKPRKDETIWRHARTIWEVKNKYVPRIQAEHSEDYCILRALDLITEKEGEKLWPSLKGHETNRLDEMEKSIFELENGFELTTVDHRVIPAVITRVYKKHLRPAIIKDFSVVNKSWPMFWKFIDYIWDFEEMYMEDVNEIGLQVTEFIKGKLKTFGIDITASQEDEIYVPLVEKLEGMAGCPDYRRAK